MRYPVDEAVNRWIGLCRLKANEFEHPLRGTGATVSNPTLDAIAEEMEAFLLGLAAGEHRHPGNE